MPVFHRGKVIALARRHDPSPGRRRHVGGIGADQRHRDLPGGPADSAAEAARRRRLQRHAGQDDPPERAHPRHGDGRPQCPGRGLHGGGAPAGRARRRLRPQSAGLDLRRAPAAFGDDDPQGAARHPRGHLSVRRLPRQRRHRARQADPHRGRRHGEGRRHRVRLRRHEPAGEGTAQLRAVGLAGGGVLRRARAHRPHHPDQRRLLPADQVAPARRARSSIRRNRPPSTPAPPPSSASPAA